MRQHGKQQAPQSAEETVRDIRRATRRQCKPTTCVQKALMLSTFSSVLEFRAKDRAPSMPSHAL